MASLLCLPDEILLVIVGHIDGIAAFTALSATCRRLNAVCHEPHAERWSRHVVPLSSILCVRRKTVHHDHHRLFGTMHGLGTMYHCGVVKSTCHYWLGRLVREHRTVHGRASFTTLYGLERGLRVCVTESAGKNVTLVQYFVDTIILVRSRRHVRGRMTRAIELRVDDRHSPYYAVTDYGRDGSVIESQMDQFDRNTDSMFLAARKSLTHLQLYGRASDALAPRAWPCTDGV